jgi:hypothetical protein
MIRYRGAFCSPYPEALEIFDFTEEEFDEILAKLAAALRKHGIEGDLLDCAIAACVPRVLEFAREVRDGPPLPTLH